MPRTPAPFVLLLFALPGCGLFLPVEDDWPMFEPPPRPPLMAGHVEGDLRDLRSLRPIAGAEVILSTGRKGYERRTRTDGAGRFQIGYSSKATDEENPAGDAFAKLITGLDPPENITDEVSLRVTCPGWKPILLPDDAVGASPLRLSMEWADELTEPRFDCGR